MKINAILLACLMMISCGDRRTELNLENGAPMDYKVRGMSAVNASSPSSALPVSLAIERKIIKDGSINFKAGDLQKTKADILELCKTLNAYVAAETLNNFDDRISYTQTLRVPANRFEELIAKIEDLADKVENKNVHSRDVTEEFIDVETRLKTKKEIETKYRELLKQARTVEDILSIEKELGNVRQEIESSEGRLKYLNDQVSFSTLEVSYYEIKGTDFGFASKFVESFSDGWDNLLAFVIWMFSLWPFVIALVGVAWLVRLRWRKRKES